MTTQQTNPIWKHHIAKELHDRTGLTHPKARAVLDALADIIQEGLASDGVVCLHRIGTMRAYYSAGKKRGVAFCPANQLMQIVRE